MSVTTIVSDNGFRLKWNAPSGTGFLMNPQYEQSKKRMKWTMERAPLI
jgi:hypothetical protein